MPHSFYIPVMGTAFTIDTPLFVAKYGISSTISLVDDVLIEKMRKFWCEKSGELYTPIGPNEEDARARRITAYLNLLDKLIKKQVDELKSSPFEPESEITRYFEMLPDDHALKIMYGQMLQSDSTDKVKLQEKLRNEIVSGDIDVNIMTKLDRENYANGEPLPYEFSDAASALRGYAKSNLSSTLVLSAGFNQNLYGYLSEFADFLPDENSLIKKKICLKVSDYRSAIIQGKYLAKRGIWVSEYSIESPLNCGGHAFINNGELLGPILEEFKKRKEELLETLNGYYVKALTGFNKSCSKLPQQIKITVQGGVGTNSEHDFLLKHYKVDAVGWGSPFLLVPEVTNVDESTLQKLILAKQEDVFLSASSPLGVPFWNLKNSASEEGRSERIGRKNPGSSCVKGFLRFNKDFTSKPLCQASREYQALKLKELDSCNLPPENIALLKEAVLAKSCICHDLGGSALIKRNIDTAQSSTPAICPGPNIINFKNVATLKEMINHIYGRCSLLVDPGRPHVFIKELQLQIHHLLSEIKNSSAGLPARSHQKLAEVKENLLKGIEYYRGLASNLIKENEEKFLESLEQFYLEINNLELAEVPLKLK
jgi:hypothetical protein